MDNADDNEQQPDGELAPETLEALLDRTATFFIDLPPDAVSIRIQLRYKGEWRVPEFTLWAVNSEDKYIHNTVLVEGEIREALGKGAYSTIRDAELGEPIPDTEPELGPDTSWVGYRFGPTGLSVQPEPSRTVICSYCGTTNPAAFGKCKSCGRPPLFGDYFG